MDKPHRLVLAVSVLASLVAFLDLSIVNVALPAISDELGGGLTAKQWIADAYFITLGSLILVAGSLSDLFGRKKILRLGLIGFAITSLMCAVAPSNEFLIISRALQGIAGALLVPSSLALIISSFKGASQGKAIGQWTAWTGIAFIIGPLVGGFLVDIGSWRWVFAINILPIVITMWLIKMLTAPDTRIPDAKVDYAGATLSTVGLATIVFGLIEQPNYGWSHPIIYGSLLIGGLSLAGFIYNEKKRESPMMPLQLFNERNFAVGNIATAFVYGGLSLATFLIAIFVQQVGGYTAFQAGLTLLPVTLIMFVLSPRFGELAGKYGPRFFMSVGPIVAGAGFFSMLRVNSEVDYWTQLFPGVLLFALGLSATVAPLTAAVLGAISDRQAGIGSAVNNAISRVAGLIAIAAIGIILGPQLDLEGFRRGTVVMAMLLIVGGLIALAGIINPKQVKITS